jgi:hypothetical protein
VATPLRLGFALTMPEVEARAVALAEWREAHEREGRPTPPGEPRLEIIRDDPRRASLGEYLVVVTDGGGGGGGENGGDE